jgi:hypothetical protein
MSVIVLAMVGLEAVLINLRGYNGK